MKTWTSSTSHSPFHMQEASAAAARDAQAKQVAATEAHKQMEALVLGTCRVFRCSVSKSGKRT